MPTHTTSAVVSQNTLDEITRRIVAAVDPDQIILFGSAARGEMGPNSDIDLLVIKSGVHRRQTTRQIYRHLYGIDQAVDVVVVTPDDVERFRNSFVVVVGPALAEGKVVYARGTSRPR